MKSNFISNKALKLVKLGLKLPQKSIVIKDMKRIIYKKLYEDASYYIARKHFKDELKYIFK